MAETKIEWAQRVWNPVAGCQAVSPGCANCYAATMTRRLEAMGQADYAGLTTAKHFNGVVRCLPHKLDVPLRRKKPTTWFVNSMSDLFHKDVPFEFIDRVFAVMALCTQHTFQVLTKRPERMAEYLGDPQRPFNVAKAADAVLVSQEMADTPYELRPLEVADKYFVDNGGQVFTLNGSATCVWCGTAFAGGQQDSIFCGQKCRSASHYSGTQGRNREPSGRTMRQVTSDTGEDGHMRVHLIGHGKELVHRLVLSTFDRDPAGDEQVCHRDGNPMNNHIANLRWGSHEDNWEDRKRHGNHRSYCKLTADEVSEIKHLLACGHSAYSLARRFRVSDTQVRNIGRGDQWATSATIPWPLPGVWVGTSVENQAAEERIPHLLRCPAAIRFLSCEPLLGPLDLFDWLEDHDFDPDDPLDYEEREALGDPPTIDWVICGGESGPRARPCDVEWIRFIVKQCREAGVPCFVKQLGSHPIENGKPIKLRDRKGGNPDEWPDDLRVREFPKQEAIANND